jgi:DNA ligase (NAD+)
MNIDTIGPETIEQLYNYGLVKNIADIYTLQPEDLMFLPRMGEKSAINIVNAAKASLQVPFERVLFALGIRFVGATVAKRLARAFGNIDALMSASFDELTAVDEIGERIAGAVRAFFAKEENRLLVGRLREAGLKFETEEEIGIEKSDIFKGLSIVISGVFTHHSRDEYKEMIERNGGKNTGSVSKSTSFILMGENMGPSKLEKAQKMGVRLVTEDEFLQMLAAAKS